ncbi:MAG: transglycosylase SLT domain-containing protein [Acidobacteriota bacterium]
MRIRLISGLSLLTMTFSIFVFACASAPVSTKNIASEPANSKDVPKSKDESPQSANLKYAEMSEDEKLSFVADKSNEFLSLFPAKKNDSIDGDGLRAVKEQVDSYFKRVSVKSVKSSECRFGDNLADVLQRGKAVAPDLSSAFVNQGLPAQLGLYIPMIDSEFCPCLQAPTGTLGMFQLTKETGELYGLKTVKGATPKKPDDRCNPKLSAEATAKHFKKLLDVDFGNNSIGAPFAISAFNAGEGSIKRLISLINESNREDFNYWTLRKALLANPEKAPMQFLAENYKYFPKFLAAFIVGENPKTFGIEMEPLSK